MHGVDSYHCPRADVLGLERSGYHVEMQKALYSQLDTWVCAADLAISIQVGVEARSALPIGGHVHQGGQVGVVLREEDIKHEAASMVRSAFWA